MCTLEGSVLLGHVERDIPSATNERILVRAIRSNRSRFLRNQFVAVTDAVDGHTVFLGRILNGPFFPAAELGEDLLAEIEIQGELEGDMTRDTNNRPAPGSPVYEL